MYLKYIFFLMTISVFSQSFQSLEINPIYIEPESSDDILSINLDTIQPYVYTIIPNLINLDVKARKQKFIELILPSVLIEKAKIKHMYNYVLVNFDHLDINSQTAFIYNYCNCTDRYNLLLCLTEHPTSIIIAQAAIESGWGTSRFFLEGFNLFGIHTHDLGDLKMKAHDADSSSPVYVKKYRDILSSISNYLRTLANGSAYEEFRKKRADSSSIENMIKYLTNYSARRELYVNDIHAIIEYNNLYRYDTLELKWK